MAECPQYSTLSNSLTNHNWLADGHADPGDGSTWSQKELVRHSLVSEGNFPSFPPGGTRNISQSSGGEDGGETINWISRTGATSGAHYTENGGGEEINSLTGDDRDGVKKVSASRAWEAYNASFDDATDEDGPRTPTRHPPLSSSTPSSLTGLRSARRHQTDWSQPTPDTCSRKVLRCMTCPTCFVSTSLVFVLAFCVYIAIVFWLEPRVRHDIIQTVTLSRENPKSFIYPNTRIKMDVWVSNLTFTLEPDTQTHRLTSQELGPYTYIVTPSKISVRWNTNSTVSYRLRYSYHFHQNVSVGSEDDIVYTLTQRGKPKIDLSKMDHYMMKDNSASSSSSSKPSLSTSFSSMSSSAQFVSAKEHIVNVRTVGDLLWGAGSGGEKFSEGLHKTLHGCKRNLFEGKKEIISPVFNVYTGQSKTSRLDTVYSYDYERVNPVNGANNKQGTADGDLFPPFLSKNKKLVMFLSQKKINIPLVYQRTVQFNGYETYRYVFASDLMKSSGKTSSEVNGSSDEHQKKNGDGQIDGRKLINPHRIEQDMTKYQNGHTTFQIDFCEKSHEADGKQFLDIHSMSGQTLRKRICFQIDQHVCYEHQGRSRCNHNLPLAKIYLKYLSLPNDLDQVASEFLILKILTSTQEVIKVLVVIIPTILLIQIILAVLSHVSDKQSRFILTI